MLITKENTYITGKTTKPLAIASHLIRLGLLTAGLTAEELESESCGAKPKDLPALIQPKGITNKVNKVETAPPKIKDTAIPWKIGSDNITIDPPNKAKAVIKIGRVRASQERITASRGLKPSFTTASRAKSTNKIEFRTIIPAKAIKPIMEVAVNSAPIIQCPGKIPIKVKGMGAIIIAGNMKLPNCATINI